VVVKADNSWTVGTQSVIFGRTMCLRDADVGESVPGKFQLQMTYGLVNSGPQVNPKNLKS
jgi:hypothetical protein